MLTISEQTKNELSKGGLRLAGQLESGWFCHVYQDGELVTVWVTDAPVICNCCKIKQTDHTPGITRGGCSSDVKFKPSPDDPARVYCPQCYDYIYGC